MQGRTITLPPPPPPTYKHSLSHPHITPRHDTPHHPASPCNSLAPPEGRCPCGPGNLLGYANPYPTHHSRNAFNSTALRLPDLGRHAHQPPLRAGRVSHLQLPLACALQAGHDEPCKAQHGTAQCRRGFDNSLGPQLGESWFGLWGGERGGGQGGSAHSHCPVRCRALWGVFYQHTQRRCQGVSAGKWCPAAGH